MEAAVIATSILGGIGGLVAVVQLIRRWRLDAPRIVAGVSNARVITLILSESGEHVGVVLIAHITCTNASSRACSVTGWGLRVPSDGTGNIGPCVIRRQGPADLILALGRAYPVERRGDWFVGAVNLDGHEGKTGALAFPLPAWTREEMKGKDMYIQVYDAANGKEYEARVDDFNWEIGEGLEPEWIQVEIDGSQ